MWTLTRLRRALPGALIVAAFAAPLLVFWADAAWLHPARNYYTVDTEFQYFVNSLAPFKGERYAYVDHPGTPLEVLGTMLLALTYPFVANAPAAFIDYHLAHPGLFLDLVRSLLTLAHVACATALFRAGRAGGRWDETVGAAAIATMYFAIHPGALAASTVWNHNSFSFPFGAWLLLGLYAALRRPTADGEIPLKSLVLLGLGTGLLAAVTIYLSAWLIGMLVAVMGFYLLNRRPLARIALAASSLFLSSLAGFGLAVLPVGYKLAVFRNWIVGILMHESRYLAVPAEETTAARILSNLGNLHELLPALFVATVVLLVLAVLGAAVSRNHLRSRSMEWSFTGGLVALVLALLFVFLDRPLREAYLLSIAAVLPLLAMALLSLADGRRRLQRAARVMLGVLVFAGLLSNSASSIGAKRAETTALEATAVEASRWISDVAASSGREPQQVTVLWMYGSYAPCWGLRTGDAVADNSFAFEIDRICPLQYRLNANLRYDVHGDGISIQEGAWDLIFTCDQYLRRILDAYPGLSAVSSPSVRWGCGKMNVITHP